MEREIIKPIIVEKDKKGNIVMTEEKLQEIIKEAFSNGYVLGQSSRESNKENDLPPLQTPPYYPSPTIPTPDYSPIPVSPFWYDKFYCCVSKDVYVTTEPKEMKNE